MQRQTKNNRRTNVAYPRQWPEQKARKKHRGLLKVALFLVVGISLLGLLSPTRAHAEIQSIEAGQSGYCLDDYKDITTPNAKVDVWKCNDSDSQDWTASDTTVNRGGLYCLSVLNDSSSSGSPVVLNKCNGTAGQVWLRDQAGLYNPNSGQCLDNASNKTDQSLSISSCTDLTPNGERWTPLSQVGHPYNPSCLNGTEGQKVACDAVQAWTNWQTNGASHQNLLNIYSDGNGYEEWCADFVSYIYKQAGFPFTNGERDGWDEYDANNIQYQGFSVHPAGNYTPKVGDIAFFDYAGGHVEIIVSGGPKPTFVYGDSATIDPETGNGNMEANTITDDGSAGQVIYYLSPNQ